MGVLKLDCTAYFNQLVNAGVDEEKARIGADAWRAQDEAMRQQAQEFRKFAEEMDDKKTKELATSGELGKFRSETLSEFKLVRAESRETELRLQKEIEIVRKEVADTKYALLLWQIGIGVAIAGMMAKGFHWLGF